MSTKGPYTSSAKSKSKIDIGLDLKCLLTIYNIINFTSNIFSDCLHLKYKIHLNKLQLTIGASLDWVTRVSFV